MADFNKALDDYAEMSAMLRERVPGIGPELDKLAERVLAELEEAFKPWTDFAEGKISSDELEKILRQREEADLEARHEMWGDEGPWETECSNRGRPLVFEEEDGPPSVHGAECDDLGLECEGIEDDEDG